MDSTYSLAWTNVITLNCGTSWFDWNFKNDSCLWMNHSTLFFLLLFILGSNSCSISLFCASAITNIQLLRKHELWFMTKRNLHVWRKQLWSGGLLDAFLGRWFQAHLTEAEEWNFTFLGCCHLVVQFWRYKSFQWHCVVRGRWVMNGL